MLRLLRRSVWRHEVRNLARDPFPRLPKKPLSQRTGNIDLRLHRQICSGLERINSRKNGFFPYSRVGEHYIFTRAFCCHGKKQEPPSQVSAWNVANAVTVGRIVAAPVTGVCILAGNYEFALAGLVYAGVSDWLDGFLARRFRLQTVLGSYLDPMADKLLISTSTICLAHQDVIPAWLAVLIVGRDVALVAGWSALLGGKAGGFSLSKVNRTGEINAIEPFFISKLNTALQISLNFAAVVGAGEWGIVGEPVVDVLVVATACSTAGSGLSYALEFLKRLRYIRR